MRSGRLISPSNIILFGALALSSTVCAQQQLPIEILHNFDGPSGRFPLGGVIGDGKADLCGTTLLGGQANDGVVYKLDSSGAFSLLHDFTGLTDGSSPTAGLIRDPAGNLYGTANYGGLGYGTIFKIDAAMHLTVLYTFSGGADGAYPYSGLIRDATGNLYGTTDYGGEGVGVVYKLDTLGHETVLHAFLGGADGAYPSGGVVRDFAGNLYGTTDHGGPADAGVVYKIDALGNETVLYAFTGGLDGDYPYPALTFDAAGNLYGTTGGGGLANLGVVFKIEPTGAESVLHSFLGGSDGALPETATLILDKAGNLYGTTVDGGADDVGVVYKVNIFTRAETILHTFKQTDGANPGGGVSFDLSGNLYGTTSAGGAYGYGVIFRLRSVAPAS